ncbi:MAG TPA: polysaccharide deacetylase family protein [Gammaproteobacteria bacterium]|nr:polysaccharide deacetylase family protein [Gammaproteobacteria bacterium]
MTEKRKVVFSFDDGPNPAGALNTILSTLQKNSITAEFYVLGSEVERNPSAAKSIIARGHKIQNHSWSHPDLAKASEAKVHLELKKTQDIIKKATGITATKVRPPYGAGGWPRKHDPELAKVARQLSLSIHNWDIDTEDWKAPRGIGPGKIKHIKKQLDGNKTKTTLNVLMHVQIETAKDLPEFIRILREWGFLFAKPTS